MVDSPTTGEIACTESRSIPITSELLGNVVLLSLEPALPLVGLQFFLRSQLVSEGQVLEGVQQPPVDRGFGLLVVGEFVLRA